MKPAAYTLLLACLSLSALAEETPTSPPSKPGLKSLTRLPGQDVWQVRAYDPREHGYAPDEDGLISFRYVSKNKINPRLRSTIATGADGRPLGYRYRLSNGQQAAQSIDKFEICCIPIQPFVIGENEGSPEKIGDEETERAVMDGWHQDERAIYTEGMRHLRTPEAWTPRFTQAIERGDDSVSYGWKPRVDADADDTEQTYGMSPGAGPEDFAILRPELPGVGIAWLQGFSGEYRHPYYYGYDIEDNPKLAAELTVITWADSLWLPVLVPMLPVSEPFDAKDFTERLWSDIGREWLYDDLYSLHLFTPAVYGQLEREFDSLRAALEAKQTGTAQAGITRLLAYLAQLTAPNSVTPENAGQEQADTTPLLALVSERALVIDPKNTSGIHRVAAHALVFNLHYLQQRLASR